MKVHFVLLTLLKIDVVPKRGPSQITSSNKGEGVLGFTTFGGDRREGDLNN